MLPLREQVSDTYRLLFIPALLAVFGYVIWWLSPWFADGILRGMSIGGCVGMLPSLVMGTPARMPIPDGDRGTIETWMADHGHVHDERGWAPRLPRALYFDSQIVRFEERAVIGPVVTLRKLRAMLREGGCPGA